MIAYDMLQEISALGTGEKVSVALLGEQAAHLQQISASVPVEIGVYAGTDDDRAALGTTGSVAAALASPATMASVAARRAPAPSVRLRGRSFAEEVKERTSNSALVKVLIDRYTLKGGRSFADVPSFLSSATNNIDP